MMASVSTSSYGAYAAADQKSPLDQFTIKPLVEISAGGVDLSYTNASLWMMVTVGAIVLFLAFAMRKRALVPDYMQSLAEMLYMTIVNMVRESVGNEGKRYFPFVFSLFMFVLFANLLGLVPTAFTVTSHIAVTFFLASVIFIAVTILGFYRHGMRFFTFFFPEGTPWFLAPIIVPIELLSYLSRPISLSVRLFANMTVGHVLLKVVAGFVVLLGTFGVIPLAGLVAVMALEFLVAFIQAYVFAILTCVYLHDALHLH